MLAHRYRTSHRPGLVLLTSYQLGLHLLPAVCASVLGAWTYRGGSVTCAACVERQLHAVLLTCPCYRCVHLLQVKWFRYTHSALLALAVTGAGCVLLLLVFFACLPCCSSAIVWRPRVAVPAHLVPCLFVSMHASAQSVTPRLHGRVCMWSFALLPFYMLVLHALQGSASACEP